MTGGEPFRQNIEPLVGRLLEQDLRVQIETSGTLWVDLPEHPGLSIVCSPKTKNLHPDIIPRIAAFKYVLGADCVDPKDGLPLRLDAKARCRDQALSAAGRRVGLCHAAR